MRHMDPGGSVESVCGLYAMAKARERATRNHEKSISPEESVTPGIVATATSVDTGDEWLLCTVRVVPSSPASTPTSG